MLVIDAYDRYLGKIRSALQSVIPVETGLDKYIERTLPNLAGKVKTYAILEPAINVFMMDIPPLMISACSIEEVNEALREISLLGEGSVIGFNDELLVSCDLTHDSARRLLVLTKPIFAMDTW